MLAGVANTFVLFFFTLRAVKTTGTFASVALTTVIDAVSAVATGVERTIVDIVVAVLALEAGLALALVAAFLVDALAAVLARAVWTIRTVFVTLVNIVLTARPSPTVSTHALCLVVGVLVALAAVLTQVRLAGVHLLIAVLANIAIIACTLDISTVWRGASTVFTWIRTVANDRLFTVVSSKAFSTFATA